MTSAKWFGGLLLAIAAGLAPHLAAQVQTDLPPAVAGAKPVAVEHIKIHGTALEGNLEGDAVDRDVFVFLPPTAMHKVSLDAIQSFTPCTVTSLAPSNGRMKSISPRLSKAPSL
jgi:hypothetical protein